MTSSPVIRRSPIAPEPISAPPSTISCSQLTPVAGVETPVNLSSASEHGGRECLFQGGERYQCGDGDFA